MQYSHPHEYVRHPKIHMLKEAGFINDKCGDCVDIDCSFILDFTGVAKVDRYFCVEVCVIDSKKRKKK